MLRDAIDFRAKLSQARFRTAMDCLGDRSIQPPAPLTDVFFGTAESGAARLRLRRETHHPPSLMSNTRRDFEKTRARSVWSRAAVRDADDTEAVLASVLGVRAVVDVDRQEIHLAASEFVRPNHNSPGRKIPEGTVRLVFDRVDGLGYFVKGEYVVPAGVPMARAHALMDDVMECLRIEDEDLVADSYDRMTVVGPPEPTRPRRGRLPWLGAFVAVTAAVAAMLFVLEVRWLQPNSTWRNS